MTLNLHVQYLWMIIGLLLASYHEFHFGFSVQLPQLLENRDGGIGEV